MPQRLFLLTCAATTLAFAACLDALYEDIPPTSFTGSWVVCCLSGRINTCPCDAGELCAPELVACSSGACAPSTAGGCSTPADGGHGGDGGIQPGDGGPPGDAGQVDAGRTLYEPCCLNTIVSTCACGPAGCDGGAFTPCQSGRCVSNGSCP